MISRPGRRYPVWSLIALGILAGVVVTWMQNPPPPAPNENPPANVFDNPTPTVSTTLIAPMPQTAAATRAPDLPADATLFIPSAGVYATIIQVYLDGVSWDIRNLGKNAGHLQGTALPAEGGNVVLSAHVEMADGSKGPFAALNTVQTGDIIEVTMSGSTWRYAVTDMHITTPDDLTPILPAGDDRLTLITCGNYDFFSNSYPDRLVVVAQRIV
jgi:LPXTG-site transpeptidase (sortase) family protein